MTKSDFSLANRKQLADLLGDKYEGLRYKAKQKLHERAAKLRKSLIVEHAEKKGATSIVKQIDVMENRIKELTLELKQLGFEMCYGDLRLFEESSNPLDDIIDGKVKKDIGVESDIDARFDSAQIAMMTVTSLSDAEKLLRSVSEV